MTAYSDDSKVTELLAPLAWIEPPPFAGVEQAGRPGSWRLLLATAALVVALGLTGVAIAAGIGVFNGFGSARPTVLDRQTRAAIRSGCHASRRPPGLKSFYNPYCHLVLRRARLLSESPKLYAIPDTRGELCSWGAMYICTPPLSRKWPITFGGANPGVEFFAAGLAMDGVVSVSFTPVPGNGKEVTVPVKDHLWSYTEQHTHASDAHCIDVHMADGSTIKLPGVPCP